MKTLPVLLLAGCLRTDYQVPLEGCEPQVQELERACQERKGLVYETAQKLKACLGEDVKIMCSWGDAFEPDILTIETK